MKNKTVAPEHDYRSPSFDELNRVGNPAFVWIIFEVKLSTLIYRINGPVRLPKF